jgi:glucose-6-phosphate 1-dehydrogenase
MSKKNSHIPTIFVVLGVTGDLTAKKIVPALFNLHEKKALPPKFEFVGVSRRDWNDEQLREHVRAILHVKAPHASERAIDSFLKLITYAKVRFDAREDYVALRDRLQKIDDRWGMCTNKLFYLSVPPQFYDTIFENLHGSHLTDPCSPEEGWTRVVIEKPFGDNEASAKALDARLAKLFKEEQIYRIDHYLAKETFQNILAFRFANNLFENDWGSELIEKINIREWENIGVEDRGSFYDAVGALRDVGQNHLLQMLALTTMDAPRSLRAEDVRAARAALLEQLEPLSMAEVAKKTFRAQYEGYHTIAGVAPHSQTETYFRAEASLAHPRWRNVAIHLEAGKRIFSAKEEEVTEIEVTLRHPEPCLCSSYISANGETKHFRNRIIFRQDPKESITIHFWAKKPGFSMELEERTFAFELRRIARKSQYAEEYEKLLLDAIAGDQTLFVSSEEIAAMWRFIDPIMKGWEKNVVPLREYVPDSPSVTVEAAMLLEKESAEKKMPTLHREIGIYGLGKMGANLARQLREKGWQVIVANRSEDPVTALEQEGFEGAHSITEFLEKISANARSSEPRIVWLMVTAGKPVDDLLFAKNGIASQLKRGDIVIDGGNSFFEDSMRRAALLAKRGIKFLDVGVSGGPSGARNGACMMIGGDKKTFEQLESLFQTASVPGGYAYFGKAGTGHFTKMVHNGIEYGMMQSIAEGFALMKKSPFKLSLEKVARLYNHGSVIESRLMGWLESAYRTFGEDLKTVSGTVAATGEGEWTIKTGKKWRMKLPAIEDAFKFRLQSKKSPSYLGKVLSALRNQFGGHTIK